MQRASRGWPRSDNRMVSYMENFHFNVSYTFRYFRTLEDKGRP